MYKVYMTVIIPLYNKKHTIKNCMLSIENQKRLPDEILIINDGSTDGSDKIASKYRCYFENMGISFNLISKSNGGVSSARNAGIKAARNDSLLCFFDADDTWDISYLEEIERAVITEPNYYIYSSGYNIIFSERVKEKICVKKKKEIVVINYNDLNEVGEFPYFPSSFCINKNAFKYEDLFFPESQDIGEDITCFFLLGILYDTVYVNKPLVSYCINTPGNTASNDRPMDLPVAFSLLKGKNSFHGTILTIKDINYHDYLLLFFLKSCWKSGNISSLRKWCFSWKRLTLSRFFMGIFFFLLSLAGKKINLWTGSCIKKLKTIF